MLNINKLNHLFYLLIYKSVKYILSEIYENSNSKTDINNNYNFSRLNITNITCEYRT